MKLSPEEKANRKKAIKDAREARKVLITAGGEKATIATIENVVDTLDERLLDIPDAEEFDDMRTEFTNLKADVEDVKKRFKVRPGSNTDGMDAKKFSIGKLAVAFLTKRADDSSDGIGYELECMEATAKGWTSSDGRSNVTKKDLITALVGASGGLPLPIQISQAIKDAPRSQSVLFKMGVMNDNMEGVSAFSIPYEVQKDGKTDVTTGQNMTPGSVQEGGAISITNRPGLRMANFTPRKMAMIVSLTNDLAKLGGSFVNAFVQRVASKDFNTQIERNVLSGRGQQFSEPMGFLSRTDMSTVNLLNALGTDGRYISPADFRDFEIDLAEVDRLTDNCQFLTRPSALKNIPHEAATQNLSGAIESNSLPRSPMNWMSFQKVAEFLGLKLNMTTNMPKNFPQGATTNATALAYGDFSNLWIPFWGPMEMLITKEATVAGTSAYENDLTYFRFIQMYDSNVIDPRAFIVQKGFKTE